MQSLRQYRKFGKQLEAQLSRNREESSSKPPETSSSLNPQTAQHGRDQTLPDVEKGENDNSTEDSSDTPSGEPAPTDDPRQTLSRASTQGTHGTALGVALTGIDVRDRTTKEGKEGGGNQVFVVDYEGPNDPMNPHNWSYLARWMATFAVSSVAFIVGFASSIDSAALMQAEKTFGVSDVTESLATAVYLIGFGIGALFAG